MIKSITLLSFFLLAQVAHSQKDISLNAIWKDRKFATKSVPGFNFLNDGRHYTRLENNIIKKYDVTTGKWVEDLFDGKKIKGQLGFEGKIAGYTFNDDESMIVISSEHDKIYRRSYLAKYHVYNRETEKLHAVYEEGKVMNATLSPDSKHVGYVYENNLYYYELENGITLPITFDGKRNEIINGVTDWVYEEEFALVKAFWWAPDSKKIAYLRFDESEVKEFRMTYYNGGVYPKYEEFKYPKVGEKNAEISAHLYSLESEEAHRIDVGDLSDMYIPRVKWTKDPNEVCIFKMNRHQNHLMLIGVKADGTGSRTILEEKNKYYIDITNNLTFLNDGKRFVWTSEKSGFNHIYLHDLYSDKSTAITSGNFDVTSFYGVDEKNGEVYYQAAEKSPLQKQIYKIDINGRKKKTIAGESGTNRAQFSSTYDYYTLNHSTVNTPPTYTVYTKKGKKVRSIVDNANVAELQKEHEVQSVEFFDFKTSEDISLNGWIIKPKDFNPNRQYPVFMYQYSGPGSQSAGDSWGGDRYWWFQMLAQQGYIIACVDGRGTGNRGEEFKKMTYLNLGHYETIDQIEAAKYLGQLPYTDASRIGIFGWSYGGYMSSLAILKGNDVFNSAIAVAPVTSWKWYDTIYTERYMRTTKENAKGYKENAPVNFAGRLRGNYLLVHGGTDDNVHLQNSMEMSAALISANKQFDTYIYPNRNHGIYGDNARLHLYSKMTNFLNTNLKNGPGLQEVRP